MNKLTTIIVDDEPLALNLIRSYLQPMNVDIVAECHNGKQAIQSIIEHKPELIFLDIQMPGLTGFDVIQRLQADLMPMVVFVTAYDQYALKAFDVHAVDYLLKPLERERLQQAVQRCEHRAGQKVNAGDEKTRYIKAIHHTYEQDPEQRTAQQPASIIDEARPKLVIKDRGSITLVDQSDIDWVDAAGDYMCVHVAGKIHIMRSTLKGLINQLDPALFQRIHRSTIVNLERVKEIIPLAKSEYYLVLNGEEQLKVSRNYKSVVRDLIDKYS